QRRGGRESAQARWREAVGQPAHAVPHVVADEPSQTATECTPAGTGAGSDPSRQTLPFEVLVGREQQGEIGALGVQVAGSPGEAPALEQFPSLGQEISIGGRRAGRSGGRRGHEPAQAITSGVPWLRAPTSTNNRSRRLESRSSAARAGRSGRGGPGRARRPRKDSQDSGTFGDVVHLPRTRQGWGTRAHTTL